MTRISFPAVVLPVVCAAVSAWVIGLAGWESLRAAVIPAISMIAAAVLVRLARGLPFTNPDHFTLDQFRDISQKLQTNARYLRALIWICIAAVVAVTIGGPLYRELPAALPGYSWAPEATERALSAAIGFLVSYSFVRIFEVVQSDVVLLKLQANIIEGVIAQKNAKAFEKERVDHPAGAISGAGSFGTRVQ